MDIRRVVTGHNGDGNATFIDDGSPTRGRDFKAIPGMSATLAWATEYGEPIALDGSDPCEDVASYHPGPGGTRLLIMQFPPDAVYGDPAFDPAAAGAENMEIVPGIAERFEPDAPGMHTTDSVDYGIVLEGTPVLELDNGETKSLKPGDIVIQNGTRHAWRNPTDEPATLAFVLIGANR
jgi:mannose-6-phosphate isomerase-like protein (cupin superfamily)